MCRKMRLTSKRCTWKQNLLWNHNKKLFKSYEASLCHVTWKGGKNVPKVMWHIQVDILENSPNYDELYCARSIRPTHSPFRYFTFDCIRRKPSHMTFQGYSTCRRVGSTAFLNTWPTQITCCNWHAFGYVQSAVTWSLQADFLETVSQHHETYNGRPSRCHIRPIQIIYRSLRVHRDTVHTQPWPFHMEFWKMRCSTMQCATDHFYRKSLIGCLKRSQYSDMLTPNIVNDISFCSKAGRK